MVQAELRNVTSVDLNTLKMQVSFYSTSNREQQQSNKKYSYKEVETKQDLASFIDVKKQIKAGALTKGSSITIVIFYSHFFCS